MVAPNVTMPYDILLHVNQITNDWFGRTILLTLFMIIWMSMNYVGTKGAFAVSCFVVSLLTVVFFFIGLVTGLELLIAITLLVGSIVGLMTSTRY